MKKQFVNQFTATPCTAAASDARSCSRACESTSCARFAMSLKDAHAVSFFVIIAIVVSIMTLRLCLQHVAAGLLISLLVWGSWKMAEVQWMQ